MRLYVLLLLVLATPAAAQWTDNGDGTHTLEKVASNARWTMAAAHLTLKRGRVFVCDAALIADDQCPASAEGQLFPIRRRQICIAADVPGRCAATTGRWKVSLIRCAASGPYERWPEGDTVSNAIYATACKATFKTGGYWVPEWVDAKLVLARRASPGPLVVLGEATILAQGGQQGSESAE